MGSSRGEWVSIGASSGPLRLQAAQTLATSIGAETPRRSTDRAAWHVPPRTPQEIPLHETYVLYTFLLTLAGIIGCAWLTLRDFRRRLCGTGLQSSAPAHARWD